MTGIPRGAAMQLILTEEIRMNYTAQDDHTGNITEEAQIY